MKVIDATWKQVCHYYKVCPLCLPDEVAMMVDALIRAGAKPVVWNTLKTMFSWSVQESEITTL